MHEKNNYLPFIMGYFHVVWNRKKHKLFYHKLWWASGLFRDFSVVEDQTVVEDDSSEDKDASVVDNDPSSSGTDASCVDEDAYSVVEDGSLSVIEDDGSSSVAQDDNGPGSILVHSILSKTSSLIK